MTNAQIPSSAELAQLLPALGEMDGKGDAARVPVKLFDPCGSWTWYLIEYDPETDVAFGYVDGFEFEAGYIGLLELRGHKGRMGLGIERDLYWNPDNTVGDVKALRKRRGIA